MVELSSLSNPGNYHFIPALRSVYQTLLVDCRNALELSDNTGSLVSICDDLSRIFQARTQMIDIYEKLCNLTQTSFLADPFPDILPTLAQVKWMMDFCNEN